MSCDDFLERWGIRHEVSSPYRASSNGAAEQAVAAAKHLLLRSRNYDEFQENLAEYNNTPRTGDSLSPSQMLLGRRTRTFLPTSAEALALISPEERLKERTDHIDRNRIAAERSRGRNKLPDYVIGEEVVIQNPLTGKWETRGTITGAREDGRSYFIREHGSRSEKLRNRQFLRRVGVSNPENHSGRNANLHIPEERHVEVKQNVRRSKRIQERETRSVRFDDRAPLMREVAQFCGELEGLSVVD